MTPISIIIPASNEAGYITDCLNTVLNQDYKGAAQIIVVANGCVDDTATRANAMSTKFAERGWQLDVLESTEGSKIAALNMGDAAATYGHRLYLDADIEMDRDMLSALMAILAIDVPRYAGGKLVVAPARSAVSRAYGRFWSRLPFMTRNVTGAGLFAVNPAGRARWGTFPQLISDDTFVRLHFAEHERVRAASSYRWPLAEGFGRLVRVRRRQNRGVKEIAQLHPELLTQQSSGSTRSELFALMFKDPIGFTTYAAVTVAVRLGAEDAGWTRGR